jgi:hypothetical protein
VRSSSLFLLDFSFLYFFFFFFLLLFFFGCVWFSVLFADLLISHSSFSLFFSLYQLKPMHMMKWSKNTNNLHHLFTMWIMLVRFLSFQLFLCLVVFLPLFQMLSHIHMQLQLDANNDGPQQQPNVGEHKQSSSSAHSANAHDAGKIFILLFFSFLSFLLSGFDYYLISLSLFHYYYYYLISSSLFHYYYYLISSSLFHYYYYLISLSLFHFVIDHLNYSYSFVLSRWCKCGFSQLTTPSRGEYW